MTIEELKKEIDNEGVSDIGEDGACATRAETKAQAILDLRAHVCMNADHDESEKVTAETVIEAWAVLTTEEEKNNGEYEHADWYVSTEKPSVECVSVWYYDPSPV